MSAAPFDVGLVITRLQAAGTDLRKIQGATDYAAVRSLQDFPAPCAYVLLGRDTATQTKTGTSLPGKQTPLQQALEVHFGVVVLARNYREQRGAQVSDVLRDLLGQVRNALLGWTPPVAGGRACQLVSGNLEDYDNATAMWIDVWQTQQIIKPEIRA
ncbi:hypothetical protein KWH04_01155 [Xanthomonas campestris pv. trichodesmae]|uniref:Virion structural protein n=2 Tax=Xanthomonas citri TaxID=346 RepID=A0AB33CCC7_XANCI|nr:hypothetical protein [Xanthomonas citri]ASK91053.1 hypothetical protein XcvCFBP7111P_05655 [Xanthomonas citri pv. vignicola]MBV6779278.1 hypothetical protein [Xanthomonas campestris pv. trichodesmae]MBZ3921792.1 hypothetical protein [Xanthomonas campestris pv. trichodesmae]MBZ3926392.1 hypothetical protein [Xanthomonas citri pv. sesbaniae]